jgi:hypothetical protein
VTVWQKAIAAAAAAALVAAGGAVLLPTKDAPQRAAFASAADPAAPAEVWAIGDGAAGNRPARRMAAHIVNADPTRVLYLGDVYEAGTPSEFRTRFAAIYGPLLERMAPTPGNHEWPGHRSGYDRFWKSVTGVPTPYRYAFDVGGWHVVSLNSETPSDPAQLRFLRGQLGNPCTLAFWHRPRFSAGTHGDQRDIASLWQTLRGRAALVLSGHDHDMQRLKPVGGTTQVVAGAGGRDLYPVRARDRRLAFSDDRHYGALRLRLSPGRARLAFVALNGRVLDRSTVSC